MWYKQIGVWGEITIMAWDSRGARKQQYTYCRLIMHVRANMAAATELVLMKQWPPVK
ncbi:hypothetical protein VFPPC_17724 [Pochonia chlamydosporia 170]|uniref:Uncharacterized protein n=1 Tax=Pochonia chlamydosporia 170 TaxID=1380566 RepID=A0A219AQQ9_METCM|nr:hypothetical protein VFPPC_17724 [Pochonia chlamydosporia 170]OWT43100.1 hypothetical protein VFPPC_17724 [Pochonia chlamydosporia 170]